MPDDKIKISGQDIKDAFDEVFGPAAQARRELEEKWAQWDGWPKAGDVFEMQSRDLQTALVVYSWADTWDPNDPTENPCPHYEAGGVREDVFPPTRLRLAPLVRVWRNGRIVWEAS